ncbi:hypothetical protein AB0J74_19720 [Asanoa sp. NPDC049573]|uniref:hypothetical protein n=1 Tax=Asanoa sp. NPDC049573 TaxID=3155396 RepID=UPI003448250E
MTSPLSAAARGLEAAAGELVGLTPVDPGPAAFGAGVPGALGALAGELHARWAGELVARERSSAALAARLTETASTLRAAGGGYAGAEGSSARRATSAGES